MKYNVSVLYLLKSIQQNIPILHTQVLKGSGCMQLINGSYKSVFGSYWYGSYKSVFVHIDTYTQTYVHVQIYEGW